MKPVKSLLFIIGLFVQTAMFSQITIQASKTAGCDTLTVGFSFTADPSITVTKVKWDFGSGQTSNLTDPICKYNLPGIYDVMVVLSATDSVIYNDFIKVGLTPDLSLQYKDTLNTATYTKVIRASSSNGNPPIPYTYSWEIDGTAVPGNSDFIVHSFDTTGNFQAYAIATDNLGCADTATATLAVYNDIYVPNVFTPNGDKQNDELKIVSDGEQFITLQVFSKSGMLVYKTTAKTIVWDGKMSSGTIVPEGLYYYVAETDGSPSITKKGFIYVYR
ncbi:MAG TPA: gliding motility-associated C-terminal domain-containing protein [Bacteroidales bacterium]|nr:gliding motility-associated C-terminal domain-containing protein [Bacteroidales bacterium]